MFSLHPQIEQDTVLLGRFELSLVLLHREASYPWVLLVPQRESMAEIYHLSLEDRQQLMRESCHLSEVMADLFVPDKMNVAAIGNKVAQLHVHHVARFKTDPAWPGPIWGADIEPKCYGEEELRALCDRFKSALAGDDFTPA
ncbi:HIT domain-containing protein [Aurantivibrio plasticivorans]